MALQLNHSDSYNNTYSTAYLRIEGTDRTLSSVMITLCYYKDSTTAADSNYDPYLIKTYVCDGTDYTTYFEITPLDIVNQNTVERGYVYLKTIISSTSDV